MEKVSHHYVPQFYLRNFSNDNKSIGMYLIQNQKYIKQTSIKKQACKDYLYGKDDNIENWFMGIEKKVSKIISDIISNNIIPPEHTEEHQMLLLFMLLSEARDLKTADSLDNMLDKLVKVIAKIDKNININDEQLGRVRVKQKIPNLGFIQSAARIFPILFDLKSILIISKNDRLFITSDHPLVKYNLMYIERKYDRDYGYGSVGIQLFFPITPRLCICTFDHTVYDYKPDDHGNIEIIEGEYMDELNKLIYLNSYNNIFFNNNTSESYIYNLERNCKSESLNLEKECTVFGNDTNKIIVYSLNRVKRKIRLPFFEIKPEFMKMSLPLHMAGLIRSRAEQFRED